MNKNETGNTKEKTFQRPIIILLIAMVTVIVLLLGEAFINHKTYNYQNKIQNAR